VTTVDAGQPTPAPPPDVVEAFHRLYYDTEVWKDTHWLGVPIQKCPLDLWIYQEILWELRPDLVVETGTFQGGSALFLASMCDLLGRGRVVTIDVHPREGRPAHERIAYLTGSSTDPDVVERVRAMAAPTDRVLVILDSDHSQAHVLAELRAYAPLVSPGSYLIVEDTNVNGHPVLPAFGPGPMEAVREFLAGAADFVADPTREKLLMGFNPGGWLRRVR
jgi:cephalosporin hydroxylase